ncbi:hypothetical protein DICVIV_11602 [Dictyocaulus viviparus]|uniref:Uncharacterized protein n=1 Tax=Dictyocaulus viviparus TaxID=29172 RepID=A0A0D8XF96_DICVI|nr:hypothetical protein DICVIV_11602 [Dictyocaulus viviparus]
MDDINQSFKVSKYVQFLDDCISRGTVAMGFLFAKVDDSVLSPAGKFSCFLIDCCLYSCLDENEKDGAISSCAILHSAVIKRILTIAQDYSYPLTADAQCRVIAYVFRSWDIPIEVVCHEAVDIFSMLMMNHGLECLECKSRCYALCQ